MNENNCLPNILKNRISEVLKQLSDGKVNKKEITNLLRKIQNSETDLFDQIKNESEENYRGIYNSVSDAIYILAKDATFIDINTGAEKMYGYTKEQLIGKTPAFLSAPNKNNLEEVIIALNKAYNGENQEFKFWGLRKNGEIFPKIVRLFLGKYYGEAVVIAIGQDISQKIAAEENIKKSEEKFKNLIQFAPDAFFQGDAKGNFIECNNAACELAEYSKDELLKMNMGDLFSSQILESKPLRFDLLLLGKTIKTERELLTKSGKQKFVEMNSKKMEDGTYESFIRDITKRKIYEKTLIESEERYRQIVLNLKQAYYEVDKRGVITYTNPEFRIISGYKENELIGKLSFSLIVDKYKRKIVDEYKKCLAEKSTYINKEIKIKLNYGNTCWVELLTHFIYDKNGKFVKVSNIVRDISERKEIEEDLKETEKNFRLLFENSPLGTYVALTDGSIIDGNKALLDMLGSPSLEATKQINVITFPPLVNNGYSKLFMESVKTKKTIFLELPYKSKWGKERFLKSYIVPLVNEIGSVEKVFTIMEDITERKNIEISLHESEELFRNLSASTPTAIFVYQDENFVFVNKATEKLTGYSENELLKMKFWEVVHPDNSNLVRKRGLNRQLGEAKKNRYQFKLLNKNGEEIWIDFSGERIKWNGKNAALGSANDITSLKVAEEKLKQSEEKYRIFSELSSDYIYTTHFPKNSNAIMNWVGGSFEKIIGCSFEEFKSNGGWHAILHPDDVYIDLKASEQLRNNKRTEIEVRIFNKKREIIWVKSLSTPVWSENEKRVTSIYGSVKDITEIKNAELALKESKERYKLISNLTSDYLFSVKFDENNKETYYWVGGSFTEITGYTLDEYKNIGGWRATLHPDDLAKDIEAFNKLSNNEKVVIEVRTIKKNGQIVWVESFGSPVWDVKNNRLKGINGGVKDITKEKKVLLALQEREEKYKLISGLTSDYLFESRIDENNISQVTWIAGSFKKITGYGIEEYKKVGGWSTRLHKDDVKLDINALNELHQNKKVTVELRTYNKANGIVWVRNSCSPIWDYNKNRLKGIIGSVKDITKEKQNQLIQEIHYNIANAMVYEKSEINLFLILRKELNKLFDTTNFVIAFYDENTEIFTSDVDSDEKDSFSSWPAEKSISGYLLNIGEKLSLTKNQILEMIEKGLINQVGTIPEIWLGVPLKVLNKVIGVMVVQNYNNVKAFDNISIELFEVIGNQLSLFLERNKAKEDTMKLSRAIVQSPISIIITDIKGDIEYVNPMFEKVSQFTFEEVFGKNIKILKSDNQTKAFYKNLWDTILAGKDWQGELQNKKKNGELYWENVVISPIQNEKGNITHFVAIKENITEKKKMIEELISSKEQAEVSEKIKTEFLAQMSHEIRSPLNVILSFIGLIKDEVGENLTEDMTASFQSINSASTRIIRTIDLILNMTDLQLGSYNLSVVEFNVAEILNRIIKEYIQSANNKGLELKLEMGFDYFALKTDEYAILQIVSNLVDNAIKYTDKGIICVRAEKYYDNGLIIKIIDTGIGMSDIFLPKLFNSFTQEEQGYTRSYDGNGLGMALVKKYCDVISAEISVVSKKNIGSTFTIIVPNILQN